MSTLKDKILDLIKGTSKKLVLFFGPKDREKYATELWKHREIPSDLNNTWVEIERFQPALKLKG